jgi:hypothetical protein
MTAQINDAFRYRKKEYSLAGISEGDLFDISVLGLNPIGLSSACWRGYLAVFAVVESRLVLDTLHVSLVQRGEGNKLFADKVGPVVNGVAPSPARGDLKFFVNNSYEGLDYHLKYSGRLLLADGFIQGLYVHMGFHPAWKYETVIELVFDGGVLKEEFDRSERMAEIREMVRKSQETNSSTERPSEEELKQFVARAFDRRYWR